jgi:hypothetical protein
MQIPLIALNGFSFKWYNSSYHKDMFLFIGDLRSMLYYLDLGILHTYMALRDWYQFSKFIFILVLLLGCSVVTLAHRKVYFPFPVFMSRLSQGHNNPIRELIIDTYTSHLLQLASFSIIKMYEHISLFFYAFEMIICIFIDGL